MDGFTDVVASQDQGDLPHYLVIKFDPTDQPSGLVDFQDLSQLVQGLEDIILGILTTDMEEAGDISQDQANLVKSLRITAFAAAGGSYEIVITLGHILDFMVRVSGIDPSKPVDPQELLRLFTLTIGSEPELVAAQAGEDLYNDGRQQLARLLSFLRSIRTSNLEPIVKYADSQAKAGVRKLLKPARRPGNLARPITVASDHKKLDPVALDGPFETGANKFIGKPVPGPAVVAVGSIKSWASSGPYFRLKTKRFRPALKCNCTKEVDQTVRSLISANKPALVTGTAYYLDGVTPKPPPLYIRVQSVRAARDTEAFDIGYEESGTTSTGSPAPSHDLWSTITP